jgi:GNAT superfamily N-acetyltransferase
MLFSIRRAKTTSEDLERLRDLHTAVFEGSAPMVDFARGAWWLAFEGKKPVGFAGIVHSAYGKGYAYLIRSGVLEQARRCGLAKRFTRLREKWARANGIHTIVTETFENTPSANNLIGAGYRLWEPNRPWGLKGALYWMKRLPTHRAPR